jgi:hypothetical protein
MYESHAACDNSYHVHESKWVLEVSTHSLLSLVSRVNNSSDVCSCCCCRRCCCCCRRRPHSAIKMCTYRIRPVVSEPSHLTYVKTCLNCRQDWLCGALGCDTVRSDSDCQRFVGAGCLHLQALCYPATRLHGVVTQQIIPSSYTV